MTQKFEYRGSRDTMIKGALTAHRNMLDVLDDLVKKWQDEECKVHGKKLIAKLREKKPDDDGFLGEAFTLGYKLQTDYVRGSGYMYSRKRTERQEHFYVWQIGQKTGRMYSNSQRVVVRKDGTVNDVLISGAFLTFVRRHISDTRQKDVHGQNLKLYEPFKEQVDANRRIDLRLSRVVVGECSVIYSDHGSFMVKKSNLKIADVPVWIESVMMMHQTYNNQWEKKL